MLRSFLVLGALLVMSGAAPAQAPPNGGPADPDASRFSYHRSGDGFVRLDQRTGQVSYCARRQPSSGWSCLVAADDRAAFEAEISRLQADNAALKKALLDRGAALPGGVRPDPPAAAAPSPDAKSPNEAEVDRVMSLFERIWRRLVEMMANLQRDLNKT
jgi:hypothetical protein